MPTISEPVALGRLRLRNRMVLAPMTRIRSGAAGLSTDALTAEYSQRTNAGLIITEGLQPSEPAPSGAAAPFYAPAKIEAWRRVTDEVHMQEGAIFSQILQSGWGERTLHGGPGQEVWTLSTAEISAAASSYAAAAQGVMDAGFDGVELHGAGGHLLDQFLSGRASFRTDRYGGSVTGRIRFIVEAVTAAAGAVGSDRVGLRLSPSSDTWTALHSEAPRLYGALLAHLAPLGLGYVHLTTSTTNDMFVGLRAVWPGTIIASPSTFADPVPGMRTETLPVIREQVNRWLGHGADLIAFGRPLLSSPEFLTALGVPAGALDLAASN